ncbi:MAG TPA: class I SAM-dependent methyltransferase [Candidatus Pelethocola excrementipullorum]|nr:class I SAM-dependent methyltransferase [Candidatus Pelethocola excrementipullorum]
MLNSKEFDLWADDYDRTVDECKAEGEYPFAGYDEVLEGIYQAVHSKERARVLDVGFGTGVLTKRLYDDGHEIYGVDFSEKMIEIAGEKMPEAKLVCSDFVKGLPRELEKIRFDFIITTYAIHHLTDREKVSFITQLLNCLEKGGVILIGDVAFKTREELMVCQEENRVRWDTDERYLVFDELNQSLPMSNMIYKKVSHCAGIVAIKSE